MKNRNNGKLIIVFAALAMLSGIVVFLVKFALHGNEWAFYQTNGHVYTDGEMTEIGKIIDRDGNVLAYSQDGKRLYSDDADIRKATIHAVGDSSGYISTGAQNAFKEYLSGYSKVNGFYTYTGEPNNIELTIDSSISVAAMKALGDYSGCVGVCNYKTGEILCMVSTPTYDIADINAVIAAENGSLGSVFINRFISSTYTPGSTFKIVTAAAALETLGEDSYKTQYQCNFGTLIDGETLSCVGCHYGISLKSAFSHSCNAYFSQLGVSLGKTKMNQYAEIFGFNKDFYIDGIKAARPSYGVENARNIDFGWSSIGQYTNQMNPLQYLCSISAIANGGTYVEPYFLKAVYTAKGSKIYSPNPKSNAILSKESAEKITELMDFAVSDNYGKENFGTLDVCGKTGTAEIGENKENSLFVGFCKDSDLPLAFVVVVEDGGSGSGSALAVAKATLAAAEESLF